MIPWAMAAKAGFGLLQTAISAAQLAKINKTPTPEFTQTPQMMSATSQAEQMAKSGFTPQERAAYDASLSTAGNTAYRRGVDMGGGNMAVALNSALNAQNLGARNELAIADAGIRRQNIASRNQLYGEGQELQDRNTQYAMQNRSNAQQAWGGAMSSGLGNLMGGATSMLGFGGEGGGNTDNTGMVSMPADNTVSTMPANYPQNGFGATNAGALPMNNNNPYYAWNPYLQSNPTPWMNQQNPYVQQY